MAISGLAGDHVILMSLANDRQPMTLSHLVFEIQMRVFGIKDVLATTDGHLAMQTGGFDF